jgi:hypothetical protein
LLSLRFPNGKTGVLAIVPDEISYVRVPCPKLNETQTLNTNVYIYIHTHTHKDMHALWSSTPERSLQSIVSIDLATLKTFKDSNK